MPGVLEELEKILRERRAADPAHSYVASLYAGGVEAMVEKIREEAGEVIEAARGEDRDALVHEVADLWFHVLVLLAHADIPPARVLAELERRLGRSGLEEKAARPPK